MKTTTLGATGVKALAGKYLTFQLGEEAFGLPVLKVREIIKLVSITQVPQMPSHIRGVINMRGKIIPVLDLRLKFGLATIADTDRTCIMVVQVMLNTRTEVAMGLVVDAVEEVTNITAVDIEETPEFGTSLDTSNILGMAKIKNQVVSLLDIDRVLGGEQLP